MAYACVCACASIPNISKFLFHLKIITLFFEGAVLIFFCSPHFRNAVL